MDQPEWDVFTSTPNQNLQTIIYGLGLVAILVVLFMLLVILCKRLILQRPIHNNNSPTEGEVDLSVRSNGRNNSLAVTPLITSSSPNNAPKSNKNKIVGASKLLPPSRPKPLADRNLRKLHDDNNNPIANFANQRRGAKYSPMLSNQKLDSRFGLLDSSLFLDLEIAEPSISDMSVNDFQKEIAKNTFRPALLPAAPTPFTPTVSSTQQAKQELNRASKQATTTQIIRNNSSKLSDQAKSKRGGPTVRSSPNQHLHQQQHRRSNAHSRSSEEKYSASYRKKQ